MNKVLKYAHNYSWEDLLFWLELAANWYQLANAGNPNNSGFTSNNDFTTRVAGFFFSSGTCSSGTMITCIPAHLAPRTPLGASSNTKHCIVRQKVIWSIFFFQSHNSKQSFIETHFIPFQQEVCQGNVMHRQGIYLEQAFHFSPLHLNYPSQYDGITKRVPCALLFSTHSSLSHC